MNDHIQLHYFLNFKNQRFNLPLLQSTFSYVVLWVVGSTFIFTLAVHSIPVAPVGGVSFLRRQS
jgi:hypothetical protein